jgi:hypothetical protein
MVSSGYCLGEKAETHAASQRKTPSSTGLGKVIQHMHGTASGTQQQDFISLIWCFVTTPETSALGGGLMLVCAFHVGKVQG